MICPKCSAANPDNAYFCTVCHYVLIHRCPKCWHEQRSGDTCEKCGTNFTLFWELALEQSLKEQNTVWWDKFQARVFDLLQVGTLPFTSLAEIVRMLLARLIAIHVSNR